MADTWEHTEPGVHFLFIQEKQLQLPKEELATNSESLANKVRMLRAHGASIDVNKNHESKKYFWILPNRGHNYRMSDIHASLGISQLPG